MAEYYIAGDDIKITNEEIFSHLQIAKERLHSAKILLEASQYRDSVSRSYYAFLDVANAMLLTKGIIAKLKVMKG